MTPPSAAETDLTLLLEDRIEFNPTLSYVLRTRHGITIDDEDLLDRVSLDVSFEPRGAFDVIEKICTDVPWFEITYGEVIANFSYTKLPMVTDLQGNADLLEHHDIVAAIAGVGDARSLVQEDVPDVGPCSPDHTPPQDEFLVLDADHSQSYAINSALAGQNLVIKGPPGTGKSQTIANVVASMAARGRSVLFVAEKRAAIDAVTSRLGDVGLGELVLDLHDGGGNKRQLAQTLQAALEDAQRTPQPDVDRLQQSLASNRNTVLNHDSMLHDKREPWGVSVYDAQDALFGLGGKAKTPIRFRGQVLTALTSDALENAARTLHEYVTRGGPTLTIEQTPWARAEVTGADVNRTYETVQKLAQQGLPHTRARLDSLIQQTGLPQPATLQEWQLAFGLLDSVHTTLSRFSPAVWSADLDTMTAELASKQWRRENAVTAGWLQRRRSRKAARALLVTDSPDHDQLHAWLTDANETLRQWQHAAPDTHPALPTDIADARSAYEDLSAELRALGALMHSPDLTQRPASIVADTLENLASDHELPRVAKLNELRSRLAAAGLAPLVEELDTTPVDAAIAVDRLSHAWYASILEHVKTSDSRYSTFDGDVLRSAADGFQKDDIAHIAATPARVRRAVAERLTTALNHHGEQRDIVRAQAGKKRGHLPLRKLVPQAPDVLTAAKPCWAMSPLVVSQALPAKQMFDVVIFDEASQVPPADAICSIMRAHQVVVAGDERQLPPTNFFGTTPDDEDDTDNDEPDLSLISGFESILDALASMLPARTLTWHYRSRDERLIAFSNAHIYGSSLTSFPGTAGNECLRWEQVHGQLVAGQTQSLDAEVNRVVELAVEHARTRPTESLGVITMGIKHKERIEEALRRFLNEPNDVEEFFDESHPDRFFVKNLESVQGDERDAIIISVGYAKHADGRMRYQFGPLNQEGGERRLNVAVTRAKRRLTLVAAFSARDLEPSRLNAEGAKLLRAYLEFVASGGTNLGTGLEDKPQLNPFERDIGDRLSAAGIPLQAQFGVSGYRIDFAASHPERPGEMVLAVEADGASYHSTPTARDRDRLRQEHLERLGWTFHRIWSTDWFRNPEREVARVHAAYDDAVARADNATEDSTIDAQDIQDDRVSGAVQKVTPSRIGRCPITPGLPITEYSRADLLNLLCWIDSDTLLRTDDQYVAEAMEALGFKRRGNRILAALDAAIQQYRVQKK